MEPIIYRMRLDAAKQGSQASIRVKRGEIKSRQISAHLYNGSVPYKITEGCTAVLNALKPDLTIVYTDCTINGNIINSLLPAQIMAVEGTVDCELALYGANGELLYSPQFQIYVSESLMDDEIIESSSEFNALTAAMTEMTALKNAWSNPSIEAVTGDSSAAVVVLSEEGVNFLLTLEKGDKGEPGVSFKIGTVTTIAPDQPAYAINVGTPSDVILDLYVPQGKQGEIGPAAGFGTPEISVHTLAPGADATAEVDVTGPDTAKVLILNLGLPRGDIGPTFTPALAEDGTLSWTNDGGLENPEPQNLTGPRGKTGTIYTPSLSEDGTLSWTNDGGLENPATVNLRGPIGETGHGFTIQGYYATLSELEAAVVSPASGDAYGVGASAPYDIYIWEQATATWVNNGSLEGPKGTTFIPSLSEDGTLSWSNDGGLENPVATNISGPAGPNKISEETASTITGLLKGNGATVEPAVAGTDYAAPITIVEGLPPSGEVLLNNTYYNCGTITGSHIFIAPAGYVGGNFIFGDGAVLGFATTAPAFTGIPDLPAFNAAMPLFEVGVSYEFEVVDGVWNIWKRLCKYDTSSSTVSRLPLTQNDTTTSWYISKNIGIDPVSGTLILDEPTLYDISFSTDSTEIVSLFANSYFAKSLQAASIYSATGDTLSTSKRLESDTGIGYYDLMPGSAGTIQKITVVDTTPGVNYVKTITTATILPESGTALAENTIYTVEAVVGTYVFTPPPTGWAHGTFTTDATIAITFSTDSRYATAVPEFAASKTYEFDVFNGVWAFVEVMAA